MLPDWRLSIIPKELTNYARIMPEFKFSNYARIMLKELTNYARIMPEFKFSNYARITLKLCQILFDYLKLYRV